MKLVWQYGICIKITLQCYSSIQPSVVKKIILLPKFANNTVLRYQKGEKRKPAIKHLLYQWWSLCFNLPTCSSVTCTVGRLFILSLSAGGGPVFSNWFNNLKWEKKKDMKLNTCCMHITYCLFSYKAFKMFHQKDNNLLFLNKHSYQFKNIQTFLKKYLSYNCI